MSEETFDLGAAINRLVDRQHEWLLQQPEWPLLFLAGRTTRRQIAREVAKRFTTIPHRVVVQEEDTE